MTGTEGKRALRAQLKRARAELSSEERAACDAAIAEALFSTSEWARSCVVLAYRSFGAEIDTAPIIARAWEEGKLVALPRVLPGTREMEWHEVSGFEGLQRSAMGVEEPPANAETVLNLDALYARFVGGSAASADGDTAAVAVGTGSAAGANAMGDAAGAVEAGGADGAGGAGIVGGAAGAVGTGSAEPSGACAPAPVPELLVLVPGLAFDARGYRLGYGGGFYDTFLVDFPGVSIGLCRSMFLFDILPEIEPHDHPVHLVLSELSADNEMAH